MCGLLLVLAGPGFAAGEVSAPADPTPQEVLARMPGKALLRLPAWFVQQVLAGEIPVADLMAAGGMTRSVQATGMTVAQQKQYITHWITHYTAIVEGFNQDTVGLSTIDGRCSDQAIGDGSGAPTGYADYFNSADGTITTSYYAAPSGPTCGSTITTGLSRYFVTWVYSPTNRSAWLFFGSSDSYKVYLNHNPVLTHAASGTEPYVADSASTQVSLVAGWNLIVVKQSFTQLGPYGDPNPNNVNKFFSLRFALNAGGTPMTDIAGAFDPNCGDSSDAIYQFTHTLFANMAHLNGAQNSVWRTDVVFYNGIQIPWWYRLRYYQQGNNTGTPDATATVIVPPFQSVSYSDALPNLLHVSAQQKGYVVVDGQDGDFTDHWEASNWVTIRAYNQSASGTYSNIVPGFATNAWGTASSAKPITGVRNGRFRTNLGVAPAFNTGATTTVRVTITDPSLASPVQQDFTGVNGFWQVNDIFTTMGIGHLYTDNATIFIELVNNTTGTYWFPFATVQDGNPNNNEAGTSDPAFLTTSQQYLAPPLP
jgi:hypothetical protein